MPGNPEARSCFRGLREALSAHLSDESLRKSYEGERAVIKEVLETQPDVPVTQDSLVGFLNGFLLAGTQFATPELIAQHNDAMFAVIGGTYLPWGRSPSVLPARATRCGQGRVFPERRSRIVVTLLQARRVSARVQTV